MTELQHSQQFDNMDALRLRLKEYAMEHNGSYYLKYSEPSRLEARCEFFSFCFPYEW